MAVATVWNLASPMASHAFGTRPSIFRETFVTPGFDGETKDRRRSCQALDASHEKGFKRPVCQAHREDVSSPDRASPATVVHGG